jgi:hypothetical protein
MLALDESARRPAIAYVAHRFLRAELTEKNEQGWMEVLTEFVPGQGLRYSVISEGGSARIRRKALASVLDKEVEASRSASKASAFSTDNYRYAVSALAGTEFRIALTPLRRDPRLIDGTATLDGRTASLVRVEGQLASNPSFWVRDVRIDRRYSSVGSATLPVEISSSAHIRMFGSARFRMVFRYISVGGQPLQTENGAIASLEMPALLTLPSIPAGMRRDGVR